MVVLRYVRMKDSCYPELRILNCGHDLIGEMLDGKWKMPLWWFIN